MYVQLYITVGLKEIPKGNGEAGAYHLGPGLLRTPAGVGGSTRPRPVKGKEIWACTNPLFSEKEKNRMSEIVCWNLSWRARISAVFSF